MYSVSIADIEAHLRLDWWLRLPLFVGMSLFLLAALLARAIPDAYRQDLFWAAVVVYGLWMAYLTWLLRRKGPHKNAIAKYLKTTRMKPKMYAHLRYFGMLMCIVWGIFALLELRFAALSSHQWIPTLLAIQLLWQFQFIEGIFVLSKQPRKLVQPSDLYG